MKRFIYLSIVIFLILLTGCKIQSNKNIEIGFLIHSRENIRWATDIEHLTKRAEELGATLEIRDAGGDENLQLKQASELLELGVDVLIVVAANQNTAGGIVREAHNYGVKVISYDRMIKNCDLDYLISFEYEKVGELMVEYAANEKPGGNCIVLWGDPNDANAIFIKKGQERALNTLDNKLNIVYKSYIENWNKQTAEQVVNKVLNFSNDKIDAVISSNIPLGLGATTALSDNGYDVEDVVVTAMDATIQFVHSLLDGGITMTVTKPIEELAVGAIDLAIDIVKKRKDIDFTTTVFNGRKEVPAKLFSPMTIDKSNYVQELFDTGLLSKEEIFYY